MQLLSNSRNDFTTENSHNRERINDINSFINDYSVGNRLRMLNPLQNPNNNLQLDIHEMATFYSPSNTNRTQIRSNFRSIQNSESTSSFKLTLTIIVVPFINNNKVITFDSDK